MREQCKIFFIKGEVSEKHEQEINNFLDELAQKKGAVVRVVQSSTNQTTVGVGFFVRTVMTIFYTLPE